MKQSNKSQAEDLLAIHLKELGFSFIRQVPIVEGRKWRFDFIAGIRKGPRALAIEVDGYFKGRHGAGWGADNEKRNTATMMGYRVLVFSTRDVENGTAKEFIKSWL